MRGPSDEGAIRRLLRLPAYFTTSLVAELAARVAAGELGLAKWLIVCAHNMLQGAMVCVLTRSDETGALDAKSEQNMRAWLAPFPDLLERVQHVKNVGYGKRETLYIDAAQRAKLDRLQRLRNKFQHFVPREWSIEVAYLRPTIDTAFVLTRTLMDEPHVVVRMDDDLQTRLKDNLQRVRQALDGWPA